MKRRINVYIYGDVTGVGFRYWCVKQANKLGLTGWVKNFSRNCVEAIFEGPKTKLEEIIQLCHKGPEISWVEKVEVKWEKATNEFLQFEIKY